MSLDFDGFCILLLDEAVRFLEKAEGAGAQESGRPFSHAALLLGYVALEAHINAIGEEIGLRPGFTVHEKSLLLEKAVRLERGEFVMTDTLQMSRLEDRIHFLFRKFSGAAIPPATKWWDDLRTGLALRNSVTHPKSVPQIEVAAVRKALESIIAALDVLYQAIYKQPYPYARRGCSSTLSF